MMRKTIHWMCWMCVLAGLSACAPTEPQGADRGPALFETCATCHGPEGAGVEEYHAPAIAGLPEWYLRAQLHKFHDGVRGAHPDDTQGLRMRGMARTLRHEGDIEAVSAYVAALPRPRPTGGVTGNAARGAELFATCVQCHGERGTGDETRGAPPIAGMDPWYVFTQLNSFKSGVRGTEARDETGATMRPMTLGLSESDMNDLAAHLVALGQQ